MTAPPDLAALRRVLAELQPRLAAGLPLSPAEVDALRQGARAAAALQQMATATPLALARLWRPHCQRWRGVPEDPRPVGCAQEMTPHAPGVFVCRTPGCAMAGVPEARTSQRDTLRALGVGGLVAAMIGGANRAGKTEAVMQLALALAAGRSEPWVRAWVSLNDIPERLVPEGPGTVWVSALSFNDSKEYHRPKLDKYLPAGTKRINWAAENQAEVILPNGGRIVCKAEAQGRDKFQGSAVRLVVLDEEHDPEIFDECLRATAESDGLVLLSMTPLKGLTWPHTHFIERPRPGYATHTITGLDNPHVRSSALVRRFSHLPAARRDARLYGTWGSLEGLVYPAFEKLLHVVPAFSPPSDWPRFGVIDFGTAAPFCYLHAALSPDDCLHLVAEHYAPGLLLSRHAQVIKDLWRAYGPAEYVIADPEDLGARQTLAAEYDLSTLKADKRVTPGIDAVSERLALTIAGRPRLVIHDCCVNTIREIQKYRWETGADTGQRERPRKIDDHAMDAVRYLCLWLLRAGYTAQSIEGPEG